MNSLFPLVRKEVQFFANSAIAYVVGIFFLVLSSVFFFNIEHFVAQNQADLRSYFQLFPIFFTLMIPSLTMRTWAEEQRQGTLEVLMTLPISEWKLVIGKFLAPLALLFVLLVFTIPVPLSVLPLGHFDGGVIVTEYIGSLLLGAASIALGMWISSLTKNQVTAFLVTTAVFVVLYLLNQLANLPTLPSWLAAIINYVCLSSHVEAFNKGVLDSRDVIYYCAFTFLFLFLNERSLVLRKWR